MEQGLTPESRMLVKLKSDGCHKMMKYKDMHHIEAGDKGNGIKIKDEDQTEYTAKGSMQDFLIITASFRIFFRAHLSHIVQVDGVDKFDPDTNALYLTNEEVISYSKEGLYTYRELTKPPLIVTYIQLSLDFNFCLPCIHFLQQVGTFVVIPNKKI